MGEYKSKKNKISSSKNHQKKENTVDYYISTFPTGVNKSNWWDEDDKRSAKNVESDKKYNFLKKDIKISSIIPPHMKYDHDIPNSMGFFNIGKNGDKTTDGGETIAVGYDKYDKNTPIAFSLIPDSIKDVRNIPERDINDPNTYFGGSTYGRDKKFIASAISFKFDPRDKDDIEKLEDDNDGIKDTEEKLLYQDKKEDERIQYLKNIRNEKGSERAQIDKEIEKIKDIKEEKNKDNLDFLKAIDNFVDKLRKGVLRKYIDSDDVISRRKRIIEFSSNPDIQDLSVLELRELLKRILEKSRNEEEIPGEVFCLDLESLTREELEGLINALIKNDEI